MAKGVLIAGPLLIIAGAGTGKTSTLAHRVAHLILTGTLPQRILLLTFTRRPAAEMTNRAQRILGHRMGHAKGQSLAAGWRDLVVRYLPCDWHMRLAIDCSVSTPTASDSIRHSPFLIAPIRRTA
jgi:DNA helicase-2/ATP-dependent DNA helicase PcrA